MHPDLHRYLDGDVPASALAPELRSEAGLWGTLLAEAAVLREDRAPAWLETRVMDALPPAPEPSLARRIGRWLLQPQSIRIRPAVALAGAIAALVLFLLPAGDPLAPPTSAPQAAAQPDAAAAADPAPAVYVQFVFSGDGARSVALAGDFNDWNPERHVLRDPDGDGVWTGLFALPPGLHKYMFLVDGTHWVTDPRAERYIDDGFGMRNALITIAAPPRRAS